MSEQQEPKRRFEAMNALKVYVNKGGNVSICEEIPYDDDQIIEVTPDRLPLLIKWLQDIQAEIATGVYEDDGTDEA